jgi:hypothetical protein
MSRPPDISFQTNVRGRTDPGYSDHDPVIAVTGLRTTLHHLTRGSGEAFDNLLTSSRSRRRRTPVFNGRSMVGGFGPKHLCPSDQRNSAPSLPSAPATRPVPEPPSRAVAGRRIILARHAHHRRRRGPSFAPAKAHRVIAPPYQTATKGSASLVQCSA